jgi:hypothetical protein
LAVALLSACAAGAGERARDDAPFARSANGCRVLAPAAAIGEPVLAGCARARAEVARLLAREAPAGVVHVPVVAPADTGRRPDEGWSLEISAEEARAPLELGDGRRVSQLGYAAHESAHRIATAMLYPGDSTAALGQYGSPLPDWLDEGIALLAEPPDDQRARLALLFDGAMIYALPLRRFLYMAHPALSGAAPGSQLRQTFYGQSLAFSLYVRERAGPGGVRALVARLQGGANQGAALTALPGLPADGGALEQDWLAWLRARQGELARPAAASRPRAGCAGGLPCHPDAEGGRASAAD